MPKKGPTLEDLMDIEKEFGDLDLLLHEDLSVIVYDVKNEIGSLLDNSGKTWCEACSNIDGYSSSEYSSYDNQDKIGNVPSPYHLGDEDKK